MSKPPADNPGWRYQWVMRVLLPVFVSHAKWKSFVDRDARFLKERIGFTAVRARTDCWWHAASVGEVQTLWPLLQESLRRQLIINGNTRWLVTTNTTTGFSVLQKRLTESGLEEFIDHAYCPIDSISMTKRFVRRVKPNKVVMMETEIWPNLYCTLHRLKVPLSLINARATVKTIRAITPKSALASIFIPAYDAALSRVQVLSRSADDAARYESLGSPSERITVVGDLKFADNRPQHCQSPFFGNEPLANYVVAASTHDPEECQLVEQWLEQSDSGLLVIVPRHMERCNQLYKTLTDRFPQLQIERRSAGGVPTDTSRLFFADTLGELHDWYSGAAAVFVGGSLIERGGHNVLEPYFHGVPVVTGPHTGNFVDAVRWLAERNQIKQVANAAEAVHSLLINRRTQKTSAPVVKDDCLDQYLGLLGFSEPD